MKCLTCERHLIQGESLKCEYCIEKGNPYTKFNTADVGDGNCDG